MPAPLAGVDDDWNISGGVTISFRVEKRGQFRLVSVDVPASDTFLVAAIEAYWVRKNGAAYDNPPGEMPFIG